MTETTGPQRREVCYQGRVQGVGFRYTTQWIAGRFRATGYVRNLPDGSVLLVAEGHPEELDRFLAEVRGQMGRYIDQARETVGPATGQFSQFEIRY